MNNDHVREVTDSVAIVSEAAAQINLFKIQEKRLVKAAGTVERLFADYCKSSGDPVCGRWDSTIRPCPIRTSEEARFRIPVGQSRKCQQAIQNGSKTPHGRLPRAVHAYQPRTTGPD